MAYDPWAGYNEGMQNLGRTFSDLDRSRMAKEQHDLEAKRQALLSKALQLQVDDAERQNKMREGLTQAVNQQPQATFVPDQQTQQMPQLGAMPNTGQAPQPFQMPQPQQPASVFNTPGQIQQQQPNMERAMLEYYKKNDPIKAQEFSSQLITKFKELASTNPKGAVDWYNGVSGMSLTYEGQNGDYIITKTDDGKIIATDKKNPLRSEIVYEGDSKADIQSELIDKRFENQWQLEGMRQNRQDERLNRTLAQRGNANEQKDFRNESAMRKEFLTLPEVKEYPTIEQNSKRALKALQEQGKGSNVAVDQAIITVFNKMLDPASVVRESEYARTPQDLSMLSRLKGKWDKIQRGGAGLDSNERAALYRMINNFNAISNEQYNAQVDYYSDLADRYGYDKRNIVRLGGKKAPSTPDAPATSTKPANDVENKLRGKYFKGK